MSHFIEKCKGCARVMRQCRCPDSNKAILWSECDSCAQARAQAEADVVLVDCPGQTVEGDLGDVNVCYDLVVEVIERYKAACPDKLPSAALARNALRVLFNAIPDKMKDATAQGDLEL